MGTQIKLFLKEQLDLNVHVRGLTKMFLDHFGR